MPLGDNIVEVIAENSQGKSSTKINMYHAFIGNFQGGYSNSANSKTLVTKEFYILFHNDGTLQVENKVGGKKYLGTGEWKYTGSNTITGSFWYFDDPPKLFQATITYSSTIKPYVTGFMKDKDSPNWQNYFRIDYTGLYP